MPSSELPLFEGRKLKRNSTAIMGVLNVNDDSFYPTSRKPSIETALHRALEMADEGADIIDIGAESTRPGSRGIDEKEECARIVPVIESVRMALPDMPISVDTRKASVAHAALQAGADIVNDVSGLDLPEERGPMTSLLRDSGARYVLTHTKGTPDVMHLHIGYEDFFKELMQFFEEKIACLENAGVDREQIVLDPGIGFGKRLQDNLEILANLETLRAYGLPLLIGASRKGFIGAATSPHQKSAPEERLGGSVAVTTLCALHQIDIVRVHDIPENLQAARLMQAIGEWRHV